jgi:hypothetical protein
MNKFKKMGWMKVDLETAKEYACWFVSQSMKPLDEAIKWVNSRMDGVQITEQDYIEYLMRTKED